MFAIWWLTYLARVGLSPTGIIDLARTHTPFIQEENLSRKANAIKITMYFLQKRNNLANHA
jgi:hypothetical protein